MPKYTKESWFFTHEEIENKGKGCRRDDLFVGDNDVLVQRNGEPTDRYKDGSGPVTEEHKELARLDDCVDGLDGITYANNFEEVIVDEDGNVARIISYYKLDLNLPVHGIKIRRNPTDDPVTPYQGTIQSDLKDGDGDDPNPEYDAAVDGFEAFLLALACEGVDVTTPEFQRAIDTVVDGIVNNHGD